MVIRPRKPKGSSKRPMRVNEVKRKLIGRGNPRNEIMKKGWHNRNVGQQSLKEVKM